MATEKPKFGGRKKGAINKRSKMIDEIFAEHEAKGNCPIAVMFKLMNCRDKAIALGAAKELAQYKYAKKKHLEISTAEPLQVEYKTELISGLEEAFRVRKNG